MLSTVERPPNKVEAIYKAIDIALVVVKRNTCATGALDSKPGEQWLRTVVASANRNIFHIEQTGNVVRVDPLDVKRNSTDVALGLGWPIDIDVVQLGEATTKIGCQGTLSLND